MYKYKPYNSYYPPASWDKTLELTPESSEYYAVMVQKMGKEMADYYWNRRYGFEKERDYEYIKICREINEKCDKFLKNRKVNPFQY